MDSKEREKEREVDSEERESNHRGMETEGQRDRDGDAETENETLMRITSAPRGRAARSDVGLHRRHALLWGSEEPETDAGPDNMETHRAKAYVMCILSNNHYWAPERV